MFGMKTYETMEAIIQSRSGNQMQQASNVSENLQQISMGAEKYMKQLEATLRKKALLKKSLADKDMIIQILQRQKQG